MAEYETPSTARLHPYFMFSYPGPVPDQFLPQTVCFFQATTSPCLEPVGSSSIAYRLVLGDYIRMSMHK